MCVCELDGKVGAAGKNSSRDWLRLVRLGILISRCEAKQDKRADGRLGEKAIRDLWDGGYKEALGNRKFPFFLSISLGNAKRQYFGDCHAWRFFLPFFLRKALPLTFQSCTAVGHVRA
eukprot:RCo048209